MSRHIDSSDIDRRELPPTTPSDEASVLRLEIEATREELAQTVGAIADKVNVKARAEEKVADAKHRVGEVAAQARNSAPPQVQHALDAVGERAAPVVERAAPYRKQIAIGALVVVVLMLVRRRGKDD
jgi:uncharacterized protein DUF3618